MHDQSTPWPKCYTIQILHKPNSTLPCNSKSEINPKHIPCREESLSRPLSHSPMSKPSKYLLALCSIGWSKLNLQSNKLTKSETNFYKRGQTSKLMWVIFGNTVSLHISYWYLCCKSVDLPQNWKINAWLFITDSSTVHCVPSGPLPRKVGVRKINTETTITCFAPL